MRLIELIKKLDIGLRLASGTDKLYLAEYLAYQKRSLENVAGGKPYVLCTYYFPGELAAMFDVEFFFIERLVGIAASLSGLSGKKSNALPKAVCSYYRAFLEMIELGDLPKPALIIALSYPCKDAVALCKQLRQDYHIPMIQVGEGLDFSGTGEGRSNSCGDELLNCYNTLSRYFPLKQSIEKTVEYAVRAVEIKREIDRKRVECPGIVRSDDILKLFTAENIFGSEEAVSIMEQLLIFINQHLDTYSGYKKEHSRFFWMGLIPLYDNSVLSLIERQCDCVFLYEEMWMFGEYPLSKENFFQDISDKIRNTLFFNKERRITKIILKMKELNIDAAVNFSQKHCSFLPPQIPLVRKAFLDEGFELYNLSADVVYGGFSRQTLADIVQTDREKRKI